MSLAAPPNARRRRGSGVIRPGDNGIEANLINYEQRLRTILQDVTGGRTSMVDMVNRNNDTLLVLDPGILRRPQDILALRARLAGDALWYVEETEWNLQDETGPSGLYTLQPTLVVHRLAQARLTDTAWRIGLKLGALGSGAIGCLGLALWMLRAAMM
jgi:hypothetical protein